MPNGCVITKYVDLSDFLYKGFAIRLRIFSCRFARSNPLFLFLPIAREALPDQMPPSRETQDRVRSIAIATLPRVNEQCKNILYG